MHYYIISGELSGDLYASNLIRQLKKTNPASRFTGWGGEYMKSAGCDIVVDLKSLSFMGFWEVFKNGFLILNHLSYAKKHIGQLQPDAIILVDYPGFNLQIAEYAHKIGIPVYWFIAPQIWAWKKKRIKKMRKYIHKLFVALPFELEYFSKKGVNTFYFGHPMIDLVSRRESMLGNELGKPIIALLPGSRKQEVKKMLPLMLQVSVNFPRYRFVIICADSISRSFYEHLSQGYNVELQFNKDILRSVFAALVTSGTATLELAIYQIPQVVCYKIDSISFLIAKLFVNIKYISLVNILSKKEVVQELIQGDCNVKNIEKSLSSILKASNREQIIADYSGLVKQLGMPGCFEKISEIIYSDLLGIKKYANK